MNQLNSVLRVFMALIVSGLLVSCGGKDATLKSIELTAASASVAAGTTTQMSATGIYSDDSHKDLTSEVDWASANTAVATVGGSGIVTAVAPGTTSVSATLDDVTISTTFVVTPALLVSIEVTPATPSLATGLSVQLVATGVFTDHTTQNLTTQVTWTSSAPTVAAFTAPGQAGLLRAIGVGSANISAVHGGVSGGMTITVSPAVLTSIEVTPPSPNLAKGTSQQLTATGILSDNSTQNLTSQVSWSSNNTAVATISGTVGFATAVATGTATISATLGAVTGSTLLTVTPATLASIEVTPPSPGIANGLRQQFTATGVYTDNSTQDITVQVTWGSSALAVATISNAAGSNGLASSTGLGNATITATLGTVSGSASLAVTAATLVSIGVTPPTSSIAKGLTRQFTATGVYTDNSTQNLTSAVTWSSSATSIATISNAAGSQGLATSTDTGPTTITATLGSVSGDTQLTVTPATLVSIEVTPATPSIANGLAQQFTATGIYTDTTTQNLTTTVTWASSATAVATISNAAGSQGLANSAGLGPTTITATLGTVSGSTQLTVTPATVVSIGVTPAMPSVAKGLTQQFTATGVYTDNTTQDLTTMVTWSSSATAVATISNAAGSQGLASTPGIGSSTITATLGSASGTATLAVTSPTLVSIQVAPANAVIASGLTRQFTATGVYTDNSTQDLTTTVTWSSSVTSVATISNAAGSRGLATSAVTGSTTITATLGSIPGSTQLTVTNAILASIAVTPASSSIAKGLTQQFTATGTYTDASTQNLTTSVTWSSSVTSVATISNAAGSNGLASTPNTGTTTITATLGSVSGSTGLTVTPAVLTSIAVAPVSPSVAKGLTQQFAATGTFTDLSTQNLTTSVTWSSSVSLVATISNAAGTNGRATAVNTGSTTIAATLGSVSGSTALTVTPAVLQSISVTSAGSSPFANGVTPQFTATGNFSDATTQNLTGTASWVSSDTSIVTINSSGVATFAPQGATIAEIASRFGVNAMLTATVGSISGNTTVQMYQSFNLGTSIFSQITAYCSGCHNESTGTLMTANERWFSAGNAPVTYANLADNSYPLFTTSGSNFYSFLCPTGVGSMANQWTTAQCGRVQAWMNGGFRQN